MSEYTPTTEQVRRYWLYGVDAWANGHAALSDTPDPVTGDKPSAQFDRWLANVKAAAAPIIRADERRRVAEEIRVEMRRHDNAHIGFSAVGDAYAHAARIAESGGQ